MLTGIDVSHHQGLIDWERASRLASFAFCKATEGATFKDSQYHRNIAGCRAHGVVPGAYHFLNLSDPIVQARHFVSMIGNPTGLLTALDVETTGTGGNPSSSQAHAFAAEFARLTAGHPLVLYTGRWYWVGILRNPHGADIGPLWHSAYTVGPGTLYGGWDRFTFWQYTSSGIVPGVTGRCDLNNFYGDRTELLALTARIIDTPVPPIPLRTQESPMRTFTSASGQKPWVAVSDGGDVIMFAAIPEWAAPHMGPGDEWAPNEEWHAAAQAGVLDVVWQGTAALPARVVDNDARYDQALALVRRARSGN